MNIVIFYASFGSGHLRVAEVMAAQYRDHHPEVTVRVVDIFEYINPTLNKIMLRGYLESLQFTPSVYQKLYNDAYKKEVVYDFANIFAKLYSGKLLAMLEEFQPDVIIATHAFATGILSVAKKADQVRAPVIVVVTDYDVHPFWVHTALEYYNLPSGLLELPLTARGIGRERILRYGIPIAPEYGQRQDKATARETLGLSNLTSALIMGGGLGLGAVEELVMELLGNPYLSQLMVVAGSNKELHRQVKNLATRYPGKVHAFGYVSNIATLMSAADILFTKPGGITVTEALALQVPLAIYSALPGQEEKNLNFLLNQGLAIKIQRLDEINLTLHQYFRNPLRTEQIAAMSRALINPRAAADLAEFSVQLGSGAKSE